MIRSVLSTFSLLILLLQGCADLEYRPVAVGKEGEITVVIDSAHWSGPVGEALRRQLGDYIDTLPAPEPLFSLKPAGITSQRTFDVLQAQKNLIFVAPLSDTTNEARFLRSRLSPEALQEVLAGHSAVVPRRDLWRQQQQVVYITADTPERLVKAIHERGEDLRYAFNTVTRERMTRDMFEKGRQPDLEAHLMDRHGFAVNAQHDFFIAIDTTRFVWLRRVISSESWRSLFVYYEDGADPSVLTPEWIYQTQDALTRQYIQGNLGGYVAIDIRRPLETENINFLDRFGYETRGLWHMIGEEEGNIISYGMGGPFLTYAFYDQPSGRIYLISGMVFAPGYDKREFIRQMEVIAYTFRTRQDVGVAESVTD